MGRSNREGPGEIDGPEVKTAATGEDADPVAAVEAHWRSFRAGLRLVHTVAAQRIGGDSQAEAEALRAVAASPAFAVFGPAGGARRTDPSQRARRGDDPDLARGRWLVDRVTRGVEQARDALPSVVRGGLAGSPEQAVVLWWLHVVLGVRLEDLAGAQRNDIEPPLAGRDLDQKIEGRMWLSAKPTGRARPGLAALFHEVQAALRNRFPTRSAAVAPEIADEAEELARGHFGYEWHRARHMGPPAGTDLLTLLSMLAPEPLRVSFLSAAWGPLPPPLRELAASTAMLAGVLRELLDRGLLLPPPCDDGVARVVMPAAMHALPAERLDAAERRRWANIALRFLSVALREDTHDHDSWPEWRDAEPHVLRLVDQAEEYGEGLPEAANLMDRLSVYHRVRDADPEAALAAGARAVRLYETAGVPVKRLHATYLINYALAVQRAQGADAALAPMREGVELASHTPHDEYAGALNLYASLLATAGQPERADEEFRHALAVARECHAAGGTQEDAAELASVLNDYAAHLMRHGGSGSEAATRALVLLAEAEQLTGPDAYGIEQILLNRADALRRLHRLEEARDILLPLVDLCEQWDEPTYLLFAALADAADTLRDLGDPRHTDYLRRAHEVDDELAAER
ncbi:hypothetical protein [Streptomyces sp. NPDC049040]|uniref:hypothetical protein n=1 Tax=Streptomyces sp. NPDC049040 TaxID=3365593 RepID=UPI0037249471